MGKPIPVVISQSSHKVTAPEEASVIADAWLEQEHGKPPVVGSKAGAGEAAPPEWWSAEVEQFLAKQWPEVREIEAKSRQEKEKSQGS